MFTRNISILFIKVTIIQLCLQNIHTILNANTYQTPAQRAKWSTPPAINYHQTSDQLFNINLFDILENTDKLDVSLHKNYENIFQHKQLKGKTTINIGLDSKVWQIKEFNAVKDKIYILAKKIEENGNAKIDRNLKGQNVKFFDNYKFLVCDFNQKTSKIDCEKKPVDLETCGEFIYNDLVQKSKDKFFKAEIHDLQVVSTRFAVLFDVYIAIDKDNYETGADYMLQFGMNTFNKCKVTKAPKIGKKKYDEPKSTEDMEKSTQRLHTDLSYQSQTLQAKQLQSSTGSPNLLPDTTFKNEALQQYAKEAPKIFTQQMPTFGIRKIRFRALSFFPDFVLLFYNRKIDQQWSTEILAYSMSSDTDGMSYKKILNIPKELDVQIKGGTIIGDQLIFLTNTHLIRLEVGYFNDKGEEFIALGANKYQNKEKIGYYFGSNNKQNPNLNDDDIIDNVDLKVTKVQTPYLLRPIGAENLAPRSFIVRKKANYHMISVYYVNSNLIDTFEVKKDNSPSLVHKRRETGKISTVKTICDTVECSTLDFTAVLIDNEKQVIHQMDFSNTFLIIDQESETQNREKKVKIPFGPLVLNEEAEDKGDNNRIKIPTNTTLVTNPAVSPTDSESTKTTPLLIKPRVLSLNAKDTRKRIQSQISKNNFKEDFYSNSMRHGNDKGKLAKNGRKLTKSMPRKYKKLLRKLLVEPENPFPSFENLFGEGSKSEGNNNLTDDRDKLNKQFQTGIPSEKTQSTEDILYSLQNFSIVGNSKDNKLKILQYISNMKEKTQNRQIKHKVEKKSHNFNIKWYSSSKFFYTDNKNNITMIDLNP